MSLIQRRARPIPRDVVTLRDARLFIVATEDRYAPKQYFGFFSHQRVHVEVLFTPPGQGADPSSVLNRLISFDEQYEIGADDQLWVLLDTDHWITGNHQSGLIQAIEEARSRGYFIAMSRPCFDVWLLLHHDNVPAGVEYASGAEVAARIREMVGEFNKTNLKQEHYTPLQVQLALDRARALDAGEVGLWPEKTATRVYLLVDQLQRFGLFNIES